MQAQVGPPLILKSSLRLVIFMILRGQEFRSVNGQLQWIIADSLKRHGRIPRKTNDIITEATPLDSAPDPEGE